MLYWLANLSEDGGVFNLFRYITFRAGAAFFTALIFGFILMALELAAPGVFLFWLGLAALVVGLWAIAGEQLQAIFQDALSNVTGPNDPR